jgi:hypothetical protein
VGNENERPGRFRPEDDLSRILDRDDPERMKLTQQEYHHALAIKAMVESDPELDNLSDLFYAQLAVICQGDLQDVAKRCAAMQDYRQEYNILHAFEEGSRLIRKYVKMFPLFHLHFGFSDSGVYVYVVDIDKFYPSEFTSPKQVEGWMAYMYYCHILFQPDIEAFRKGVTIPIECKGMTLRTDVLKHQANFGSQFLAHYPALVRSQHYHTSSMANILVSMFKKVVPKKIADSIQVGLLFDGHLGESLAATYTFFVSNLTQKKCRSFGISTYSAA